VYQFDLHTHTSDHSACGRMSIEDLIEAAVDGGLAGLCVTDHNYRWTEADLAAALARCGNPPLVLLPGIEVSVAPPPGRFSGGHFLVYGSPLRLPTDPRLDQLGAAAHAAGGFVIAAHPFRPGSEAGGAHLGAAIDAVEVLNLQNDQRQTDQSCEMAAALGLPMVAGSDAHRVEHVGLYRTCFERPVATVAALMGEIRAGRFSLISRGPAVVLDAAWSQTPAPTP
jgi:predicted metal-dependent phosphoesterase TrpH